MEWHAARARESLEAAGASDAGIVRHAANGHFMGTARMGTDATTSVVDPDCLTHDVGNVLIPDGSAFVTAGSANPTTTIAAVALRAADRLLARRHEVPRPAHQHRVSFAAPTDVSPPLAPMAEPVLLPTPEERARLRVLADELIPASDDMPAASAVGVADEQLDRVLRARPDLAPALREALTLDAPADRDLATIRYVVAASYYLAPTVRAALGYTPERVTPVRPFDFPEYLEEGLLDFMLEATS
jgi:hypothetical protein